jgi:hypothetical protein
MSELCPKCGADHSQVAYCGSRKTGEYLMSKLAGRQGMKNLERITGRRREGPQEGGKAEEKSNK